MWGGAAKNGKEISVFARASLRARLGCVPAQSERTIQFRVSTRSARAKWVRAKVKISAPEIDFRKNCRPFGRFFIWFCLAKRKKKRAHLRLASKFCPDLVLHAKVITYFEQNT